MPTVSRSASDATPASADSSGEIGPGREPLLGTEVLLTPPATPTRSATPLPPAPPGVSAARDLPVADRPRRLGLGPPLPRQRITDVAVQRSPLEVGTAAAPPTSTPHEPSPPVAPEGGAAPEHAEPVPAPPPAALSRPLLSERPLLERPAGPDDGEADAPAASELAGESLSLPVQRSEAPAPPPRHGAAPAVPVESRGLARGSVPDGPSPLPIVAQRFLPAPGARPPDRPVLAARPLSPLIGQRTVELDSSRPAAPADTGPAPISHVAPAVLQRTTPTPSPSGPGAGTALRPPGRTGSLPPTTGLLQRQALPLAPRPETATAPALPAGPDVVASVPGDAPAAGWTLPPGLPTQFPPAGSPPPGSAPPTNVQPLPAAGPVPAVGGAPGISTAHPIPADQLDDLAKGLYDTIRDRLKAELRLDRERVGRVTDLAR